MNRRLLRNRKANQSMKPTATTAKKIYGNAAKNQDLEFEVDNWVISEFIVDRLVTVVGVHPFPLTELTLMTASIAYFRPEAVFEWGTHIGKSARVFYEAALAFDVDCQVYSFDLPDEVEHVEHPHETRGELVRGLPVKLYQEDGVTGALRICRRNKIMDDKILFFVDGDHSYESVKQELAAITKNHPKARILLHDTFYQPPKSKYNIGPWKAIEEFTKKNKSYKRLSTNTGLPGMTLLYKDK